VVHRLSARADFEVELIDLRDHPLPFFDGAAPARTGRDYPRDDVARLGRTLDRADAFVVLTAEYNHGYPAVLKNALDQVFPELNRKPIAFVGYGNTGGARSIEQLREVSIEFEMAPLRHAVHILPPELRPAIQAQEPFDVELLASLDERLETVVTDLVWWTQALSRARGA
jgi:NAD(P)H-dependent FMN reductase